MPGPLFLKVNQTLSTECIMQKCVCLHFRILKHLYFFFLPVAYSLLYFIQLHNMHLHYIISAIVKVHFM